MKTAKYYYECHITIEPVFDDRFLEAKELAKKYEFKIADLLMRKKSSDSEVRSKNDTFMSSRCTIYSDLSVRMVNCIQELKNRGFKVWRYKIEDIMLDSKYIDHYNLLK